MPEMTYAQFCAAFESLHQQGLSRPDIAPLATNSGEWLAFRLATNSKVAACIVAEHLRRLGENAHMWVVPPTQYGGLAEVWRCTDPDGDSILLQTAESTRAALIALGEILVKESPDA